MEGTVTMSLEALDALRNENTSLLKKVAVYEKEIDKLVGDTSTKFIKALTDFLSSGEKYKKGERRMEVKIEGHQNGKIPTKIRILGETFEVLDLDRATIKFEYGS